MASFGFSIGDFITCLSLIRQVTQGLKDSTGSVADYKSFLQTLTSLNQTITTSELVYLQWQSHPSDPSYESNTKAMVNGMLFERRQCKDLMERFLKASRPYTDAFLKRRENPLVRSWRKVTWLYQKEEISKLERDLQGHMRAMQVYADALFQNQMASHTEAMDSRFQLLLSSVVDMKKNISSISNSLPNSHSRFPRSLGYHWEASSDLAENVLLLDANGRSLLLPMLFLNSPKQFHELLNIMYRGIPGHRRILRKEYILTDEEEDGILVQESNWSSVIRAGIQLSLNMVLQASASWKSQHCPRCETPTLSHALPGQRRRCHKCQLTYRIFEHERVVEKQTVEPASRAASSLMPAGGETRANPESRRDKKAKDERLIPEEHYFKRVHYHREIRKSKQDSSHSPIAKAEKKPPHLGVERLPPLHRAASKGALNELNGILGAGEEIDKQLPFRALRDVPGEEDLYVHFGGCSPLHLAAFFGNPKMVEQLLDRGAKLSAEDWSRSQPLFYTPFGENPGLPCFFLPEVQIRTSRMGTEMPSFMESAQ